MRIAARALGSWAGTLGSAIVFGAGWLRAQAVGSVIVAVPMQDGRWRREDQVTIVAPAGEDIGLARSCPFNDQLVGDLPRQDRRQIDLPRASDHAV